MSAEFIYRILGMLLFGVAGVYGGTYYARLAGESPELMAQVFGLLGALAGLVLTPWLTIRPIRAARALLAQLSIRTLIAGVLGLILGLVVAGLLTIPISLLPEPFSQILPIVVAVLLSYFGVVVFISRQNDIFSTLNFSPGRGASDENSPLAAGQNGRTVLVDTSVIIDGRITDIARTGFLPGALLIPRFVLVELQHVADSSDKLRRQRGRRGLEVLANLQRDPKISVQISDIDVEGTREVDDKLVILARQLHAPVLTNDYNLNRVAELQGVTILNVNDLANAVKAVFLPGEEMIIKVIQEGREANQGVGYLEDGTMVVVQDGSKLVGMDVDVSVTKVLQTAAGRMIFARPEKSSAARGKNSKSNKQ
ncbi:MAG: PIN domain nuclease [Chloroflexi bacterium]|nr:PIN domain nuclease [Chloroflexota bacterium]MQC27284.1 PIN domain nuclease [Chloroflexota bacterium]